MENLRLSNVLLISIDEEVVRTVSRTIGETENAKLEMVETATRTKTHLAVVDYDLVLADTAVPDILTFMMKVLQAQQLQRPLIILYDHGDQEAAARALASGAYDALCKPIDPAFFRAALRRALHHSRLSYHLGDQQNILDRHSTGEDDRSVALTIIQDELASQLTDVSRLHELSARLSLGLDLKLVLNEVLSAVTALMAADMGVMSFYDAAQDELYPVASIGLSEEYLKVTARVPLGSGICGLAAKERRRVSVEDVETEEHLVPYREVARAAGIRAAYSVPLIARSGELIGALTTYFRKPHQASNREWRLVDLYLRQAVEVIDNARLHQASQDATSKAEAAERGVTFLAEAGAVLARSLDFDVTLRNVAQLVIPHLADWCLVDLTMPNGSLERMAVAHADPSRASVAEILGQRDRIDPQMGVSSGRVLRTAWPEMFHEITDTVLSAIARNEQEVEVLRTLGLQSCICAPLQARGRNLGVMTFLTAESGRHYGSEHLILVREVARRAALAVDHAALYQQAQDAILRKDESLALLDTLLGTAPIGFAFVDRDLRYARINDSLAAMDGRSREEHLGRSVSEVLPALSGVLTPIFEQVLRTAEPVVNQELNGETPAAPGVERNWLASFYPVTVPTGQMLGVGVVVTEITERKRVEDQIKTSLKEKDLLLKEIHHRVKNNLQIISSLLRLQADNPLDKQPAEIIQESQNRIRSMALIHEKLYQSHDLSRIDVAEYIRSLATSLFASYRIDTDTVNLEIDSEPIRLEVDAAIPCGLILNELITNALKYAFPRGSRGKISIRLCADDGRATLMVADNGVGFPRSLDYRNPPSFGLQLVTTLVDQLQGSMSLLTEGGTAFTISFPVGKP